MEKSRREGSESSVFMVAEVPEIDDVCSDWRQNRKRPTPTSSKAVPDPRKGSGGDYNVAQAKWLSISELQFCKSKGLDQISRSLIFNHLWLIKASRWYLWEGTCLPMQEGRTPVQS